MNPRDLFRAAGCTCNAAAGLAAALRGDAPSLCPVHEQGEIAERYEQAKAQVFLEERQRTVALYEQVRQRDEAANASRAATERQQQRRSELDQITDPLERSLRLVADNMPGRSHVDILRDHLAGTTNPDNDGNNAA